MAESFDQIGEGVLRDIKRRKLGQSEDYWRDFSPWPRWSDGKHMNFPVERGTSVDEEYIHPMEGLAEFKKEFEMLYGDRLPPMSLNTMEQLQNVPIEDFEELVQIYDSGDMKAFKAWAKERAENFAPKLRTPGLRSFINPEDKIKRKA